MGEKNHKTSILKLEYLLLDKMSIFLLLETYNENFCFGMSGYPEEDYV